MVNLTIEEARTRAASIHVRRYDVALDLDAGDATFESTCRISFESVDGADTYLDLDADSLRSIELNGRSLDQTLLAHGRFPLTLARGPNEVTVRATLPYSHDGQGLHRSVDPEDGKVYLYATDFTDTWLTFALKSKAWGLDADLRSSTHPVAGNGSPDAHTALTNFDGISYAKGAVVLRQLNNYLGDKAFVAGLVDHLTRHAYGNATMADLLSNWERQRAGLLGVDRSLLATSGVDTLSVRQCASTIVEREDGSSGNVSRAHAIPAMSHCSRDGCPFLIAAGTDSRGGSRASEGVSRDRQSGASWRRQCQHPGAHCGRGSGRGTVVHTEPRRSLSRHGAQRLRGLLRGRT